MRPEPLDDTIRLDDLAEDRARGETSVAALVNQDLDDPRTPSTRDKMNLKAAKAVRHTGHPGFRVTTEPVGADEMRPISDLPGL